MRKVQLDIEDIFNVPDAVIYEPDKLKSIRYVSIDSRKIEKNTLFIALKGERFDGHDFVKAAVKNGAASVLINERRLNYRIYISFHFIMKILINIYCYL